MIFIGLISIGMYYAKDSIDVIVKMTGSFVGSFEICILPVLMFYVLNKRYKIVSSLTMMIIIALALIITISLFISFVQTVIMTFKPKPEIAKKIEKVLRII